MRKKIYYLDIVKYQNNWIICIRKKLLGSDYDSSVLVLTFQRKFSTLWAAENASFSPTYQVVLKALEKSIKLKTSK